MEAVFLILLFGSVLGQAVNDCTAKNCKAEGAQCSKDPDCIVTLLCFDKKCQKQDLKCVNDCGWLESQNAKQFVQCQADYGCLPPVEANGEFMGTDESAVESTFNETGTWYILKG